jgi:hypothetical protein
MSGILLPGQEKRPQQGGGIELPKGFARRRDDEEPPAAAPEAPAAQPPAPEPARGRGRQPEFLFPPTGAQVQCPNCGAAYVVPVFTIIDLGVNPELLNPLLGGQVNMALCPTCGAGGPLSAPLLLHAPAQEFLGVYTPPMGMDDLQRQKAIGDLTQALMRKLPAEARRGYMLQPKQYVDWNRFMEKLWEFQGVTPEMLRRQRQQSEALQSLMRLADDPAALDIALERYRDLIDMTFFSLLDRMLMVISSQGDQQMAGQLMTLRNALIEKTEAGQQVKVLQDRVQAVLTAAQNARTREQLLDVLVDAAQGEGGAQVAATAATALGRALDYQFLLTLSDRLEKTTDAAQRKTLEDLRALITELQAQQRESAQAMMGQAQEVLQAVLEATDTEEALRQYADAIDETFLALLAGNIERAEQTKATAAVRRLREIYDMALDIVQEGMPPEMRLINDLLNAADKAAIRKLLEENRGLLNQEFIEALRGLEEDFRSRGNPEVADRIKSVRGQAALMV